MTWALVFAAGAASGVVAAALVGRWQFVMVRKGSIASSAEEIAARAAEERIAQILSDEVRRQIDRHNRRDSW